MNDVRVEEIGQTELETNIWVHLSSLPQGMKRAFGGYALGKRRDLSVISQMAQAMMDRQLRCIHFTSRDGTQARDNDVLSVVEEVLRNVSDEDAFAMLERVPANKDPAKRRLTTAIASAVLTRFSGYRHMEMQVDGKEFVRVRLLDRQLLQRDA